MNEKDDVILEALDHVYPVAIAPTPLHWNIQNPLWRKLDVESRTGGGFSLNTLRNRLEKLSELGLVEIKRERGSYFALTSEGRDYLRGDLDASELEGDE